MLFCLLTRHLVSVVSCFLGEAAQVRAYEHYYFALKKVLSHECGALLAMASRSFAFTFSSEEATRKHDAECQLQ